MIHRFQLTLLFAALALSWCPLCAGGETASHALIEFLDVGQGDAVLITSPEGKTLLVDAGQSRKIVELLRDRGITAIDLMVASHHHYDHYGGMDDVITNFEVRNFLVTNSPHTTTRFLALLRLVRDRKIRVLNPSEQGRTITLGSINVFVLPQRAKPHGNENDNSIGLRVEHHNISVLLTGDSEAPQLRSWTKHAPSSLYSNSTIMKVPHHGSKNGLTREWLQIVKPELAVISVGKRNGYGHPNGQILAMLKDAGVASFRTDKNGTVSIVSDGSKWRLAEAEQLARGPPAPTHSSDNVSDLSFSTLSAEATPAGEDEIEATIVYLTRTGKKYHTKTCRYGKRSSRSMTLDEAHLNYRPCKICKPPK